MKKQIVNQPMAQLFCNNDRLETTTQLRRRLTFALMLLALLLVGRIALQAQSPPTTYDAQTSDGWGLPGPPATMASGSNGPWSFNATMPAAYQYSFQLQDCPNCVSEATWSYDYHPGGSFTLGDGTDTFIGTFSSGYGYGLGIESGPEYQALTLDMYFTGQWNTGLKQAGLMQLAEIGQGGFPTGTATMSFGPAPEPGSILLFGSGIVGLAGMLRRKLLG
jgi:PEP-CTERM motif